MEQFGTDEVSRLTDIPVRSVRAMVRARYVSPGRGPRGALRFTFQDVVLLRTARSLLSARVPARRVGAALRAVRSQLPQHVPPRGLSITAAGNRIVVNEAGEKRDVMTGQLLLALEVRVDATGLRIFDKAKAAPAAPAASDAPAECALQFEAALALEDTDLEAAVAAYEACVASHRHKGAIANLGRLLHLRGRITEAVQLYRATAEPDADILYNLAVALEDLGHAEEAIATYQRALEADEHFTDAHHNLARLYQERGEDRRAVRHWNAYRRLAR